MIGSRRGRARVPAHRESVYNCGHSITLDRVCHGFGNHPAAAGRGRDPSQRRVRQSPSERCDGDCALSHSESIASRLRLGRACRRPSGTVAACTERLARVLRLTRMGHCRTATDRESMPCRDQRSTYLRKSCRRVSKFLKTIPLIPS